MTTRTISKTKTSKKSTKTKVPRKTGGAASRPYFVHPQALVETDRIGPRTRVWAFAHVLDGAVVGADCNLCDCVFVESGVVLGDHVTVKNGVQLWTGVTCDDYVFIGPNATFTNDLRPRVAHPVDPSQFARTHVGRGASLGANVTIVAGVRIGPGALIGAGSVVIRDVPAHALMVGNPVHQIGWACECGAKLDARLGCPECGGQYRRTAEGLVATGA